MQQKEYRTQKKNPKQGFSTKQTLFRVPSPSLKFPRKILAASFALVLYTCTFFGRHLRNLRTRAKDEPEARHPTQKLDVRVSSGYSNQTHHGIGELIFHYLYHDLSWMVFLSLPQPPLTARERGGGDKKNISRTNMQETWPHATRHVAVPGVLLK